MDNKVNNKNLEKEIDELLTRSVSAVYPSKEDLKKVLLSNKKLRVYIGADATGPMLHIGHSTNFILLEKFRKLGHEVIVLFGDFTAMIGDPTDKTAARVVLSKNEVSKNIKTWKKQIKPIFSNLGFFNNIKFVRNSKWLSKLSFEDVIKLTSNFTVQQMIERDMFQKRIKEDKPIYLNEFLYPLMQGYDSVVLDVDVEIGGTDQTFNMLAGRTLQRKFNNKEKFVVSTTLLENPLTGKKLMNKSEGGFVGLLDSPKDMFGKIMALPDEVMISVFKDCTNVSSKEIRDIENNLKSGSNPKDIKIKLAFEVVKIYHREDEAQKAKENFIETFSKRNTPQDIKEVVASTEELLSEVLVKESLLSSKGEFSRLVKEGAVTNLDTGEKVSDIFEKVGVGGVFKVGKHKFIKINS